MTPTLVSTEEYLSTTYHPDVNYIDGHLEERNVGEKEHGKLQTRVWVLLKRLGLAAFIETRLRLTPARYRVPDVCAYGKEPDESVFTLPPLLCVEILSPEDRIGRVMNVVQDYLSMGVPVVWVLDPLEKKAYVAEMRSGLREADAPLRIANREILLEDIFSETDLF